MYGYERAIEAAAEARRARRRPADWSLWRDMPTALVWQAVALSLDTDPDANQPIFVDCFPQDFPRRLRIAEAHVQAWSLPTIHPGPAGALYATVSLPDFATWALGLAWELPDRFPRPMLAQSTELNRHPL